VSPVSSRVAKSSMPNIPGNLAWSIAATHEQAERSEILATTSLGRSFGIEVRQVHPRSVKP
jgi:hypothetical protein